MAISEAGGTDLYCHSEPPLTSGKLCFIINFIGGYRGQNFYWGAAAPLAPLWTAPAKRQLRETTQLYWPKRRHGNDGVPERVWNAGEGRFGYVLLGVEHDRREDDDRHRQREHEKAELAGAGGESVAEDAQPGRVARELEDAEHTKHPQRDERAADLVVLRNAQSDVVRQNGDQVYNAHYRPRVPTTNVFHRQRHARI